MLFLGSLEARLDQIQTTGLMLIEAVTLILCLKEHRKQGVIVVDGKSTWNYHCILQSSIVLPSQEKGTLVLLLTSPLLR